MNQRQREIGIRMATGAYRHDIARMVIRHSMGAVLLGLGLGLAGAYAVKWLVRGLLFGVGATDPATNANLLPMLCSLLQPISPASGLVFYRPSRP